MDNLPDDILIYILGLLSDTYPWLTISYIFNTLKQTCKHWNKIISLNSVQICQALEIPRLHFLAGTNQSEEIIKLFLKENLSLRAPDKNGYSPAFYATGNSAYASMRILKIGYALDTDYVTSKQLYELMDNTKPMHILLTEKNDVSLTYKIKNIYDPAKIKSIKKLLTYDTEKKDCFLFSDKIKHHVKLSKYNVLNDSYINRLLIYAYKNWLINRLWGMMNDRNYPYDGDIMKLYQKNNINLNTCNEKGDTFLHKAIVNDRLPIIKFLLSSKNIDINIRNIVFETPLSSAIHYHPIHIVKRLVEKSDIIYDEISINHIFYFSKCDCLNLILEHGFEPKVKHLIIGLCIAIRENISMDCVRTLSKILNINIPGICDGMHLTDLFKYDHIKILLLKYGIRLIEILIRENSPDCLEILLSDSSKLVNTPMKIIRYLPLSFAAECGYINCIKVLIKYGADINLKDVSGFTALHNAVCENHINCVRLLLESGADVNLQLGDYCGGYDGYTPLHFTPLYTRIDVVKLLLEYGADKTLRTKLGFTAKDFAIEYALLDIASML